MKLNGLVLLLWAVCAFDMWGGAAARQPLGHDVAGAKRVTSCGTIIGTPGLYEVKKDLNASDAGTCITITASGVTLGLAANITGVHAGVGISIREAGVVVRGSGTDHGTVPNVSVFSIGVQDESGGNVIGDFTANGNDNGIIFEGPVTTRTIADNMTANGNAKDGIRILSPVGIRGVILSANDNGGRGYYFAPGSNGSVLANFSAKDNGSVGVDIESSSNTFRGCTVSGGTNGLVVVKGATGNAIVDCDDDGAPASNNEAFDKNGSCDQNAWYANGFTGKHKPACTNAVKIGQPVSKCGTISSSGAYFLSKDIVAKDTDCLSITAKDVILNLNGHGLKGDDGVGTGLRITSSASNFRMLSAEDNDIHLFTIGIEADADDATLEGLDVTGNADTGIFVNGARNLTIGAFGSSVNRHLGVHLVNASGVLAHNFGSNSNDTYGVFIQHSNDNVFSNFTVGNGGANGIAGLYIGCSLTGPDPSCADVPSSGNVVAHAAGALNTKYGWAIDVGSKQNVMSDLNGSGNGVFDMYEGNSTCRNDWIFDVPGTSNAPACLQ